MLTRLKQLGARLGRVLGFTAHAVQELAPVAEAVAPLTGSAAPAVAAGAQMAEVVAGAVVQIESAKEAKEQACPDR